METQPSRQTKPTAKPSMIGVFLAPTQQFERIREHPRVALPLILLLAAFAVTGAVQGMLLADSPLMQQQNEMMGGGEVFGTFLIVMTAVSVPVAMGIALLLASLFHWLFNLLFQGQATFRQIFSLNTHLYSLVLLAMLVSVAVMAVTGVDSPEPVAPTSLAAFLPAEGFAAGLLQGIEVFAIWKLVLSAMGLSLIARISKGRAWTAALVVFLAGLLVTGAFSAFGSMASQMQ